MRIIVNNDKRYIFEVPQELVIKDNRLYNTKTKSYEGVEGDIVHMTVDYGDGKEVMLSGTVSAFTNDKDVTIRPNRVIENPKTKKFEHVSTVKEFLGTTKEEEEMIALLTE